MKLVGIIFTDINVDFLETIIFLMYLFNIGDSITGSNNNHVRYYRIWNRNKL